MRYECSNIECGAVYEYDRQSCGHHAPPNYCPDCGQPRKAEQQAEERTRIGNTPTCEDCDQPQDKCTCGEESINPEYHECIEDTESGLCRTCHVEMTAPCETCGGIGYHAQPCAALSTH